jgi:DNA-binding SARP family transcriptional activator
MFDLQLFLFGPPRLERRSQPVDLGLRKALVLLVYLVVRRQPHSRDALATMFWPDHDQREGRARLRHALHRLNQALPDCLAVDSATLQVHPQASLWLDSDEFAQHVRAVLPLDALEGQAQWGAMLLGAAHATLSATGAAWWPADRVEYQRSRASIHSALPADAFAAAWAKGQEMTAEQALQSCMPVLE